MPLNSNEEIKNAPDIIDINIGGAKKQRFRINGNNDAIIELDLSDLGIVDRLKSGMEKLSEEMANIAALPNDDDNLSEMLKQADQKMREYVDYIFDYPVSAVCAKYGTMYDPKDGKFRYESIIDGLTKLYADNINAEYNKISQRLAKHTEKYTAKRGKKK